MSLLCNVSMCRIPGVFLTPQSTHKPLEAASTRPRPCWLLSGQSVMMTAWYVRSAPFTLCEISHNIRDDLSLPDFFPGMRSQISSKITQPTIA